MSSTREDDVLVLPGGRLLGYAEYGDSAGTPVLSFHGLPASRLQSRRYDDAARLAGVRLIAADRPGHGLSDFQPRRAIADWPRDVAALADALGIERFAVLGVSGGGAYALACAARLPERVTALALVSCWGPVSLMEALSPLARALLSGSRANRVVTRLCLAALGAAARRAPSEVVRVAHRWLPECDRAIVGSSRIQAISARDLTAAFAQGSRGVYHDALLLRADWDLNWSAIRAPVLLWHGEADRIAPAAAARRLAGNLPGCRATFLPGEGHYAVIPRAEELLRALVAAGTGG
jgi:pimeloyl-ACP methyl ester carboxylesterase